MTNFEFVFSLFVILLSLGIGRVLGGLARAVKQRPPLRVGWGTGLLATWVMTETILFWRIAWRARDVIPNTSPTLFSGFAIAGLCYFAAALVFPDELEDRPSLDDYFMREKAKVIGSMLTAVALAFALRPAVMGWASFSYWAWFDWAAVATIFIAGPVAMVTKRKGVAIGALAILTVNDLLDPILSMLWPT